MTAHFFAPADRDMNENKKPENISGFFCDKNHMCFILSW